jgi:hypothetical protein
MICWKVRSAAREIGKVIALGDELRPDDDVDLAAFHPADELSSLGGGPERVRRDDRAAGLRKQRRNFVSDAFDAGAAGDEAVFFLAFGAGARRWHHVAAVVALEAAKEPVLDHPGGAIRALETVAARPAQRQRGIAAPVEEEQRLFAVR